MHNEIDFSLDECDSLLDGMLKGITLFGEKSIALGYSDFG